MGTADDLERLVAIQEITQLKSRYCRCVDTKDWEGYADCLAEDFRLAGDGGVHEGREAAVAFVSSALANATTVHQVHPPEVAVTGTTATAIWPMNDYVEIPVPGGDPFVLRGYGHYHEEYVRTASGWRVKSSTVQRLRVDTDGAR